jgi:glycosyltransferase involved in cell wall biosynthesis
MNPDGTVGPRLAVIVSNAITGDSRVQKTALAAARAGWDVTLIGQAFGKQVERSTMGPVSVIRVPVERNLRRGENLRRRRTFRARLTQPGMHDVQSFGVYTARHDARMRQRSERISRLRRSGHRGLSTPLALATRVWARLLHEVHVLRTRVYRWEEDHHADPLEPVGDWKLDWPNLLDLDLAYGPVIERFRPDVIHANDITMLPTATYTAGRLRAGGHEVSWLYDAHEYVAGVEWPYPRMAAAYPAAERELIHRADAVVTVSDEIADLLQREQDLSTRPSVVLNTPVRAAITHSGEYSVRRAAGVGDDVRLLVYSGYVHPARGLDTAIHTLTLLPDVRLAVVANRANEQVTDLENLAVQLGVEDRLHIVPYVPQHAVADYLSSADLAVICFRKTPNNELSLPTKLAEYLHAGLPVACSDVKTLSDYVRAHDLGTVFTADDPQSMAVAVRDALGRRDALRANITEDLLQELSWETQSATLLKLYSDLSGRIPPPPSEPISWQTEERPISAAHIGRRRGAEGHPWRELGKTPIRLGLGPANYAGQLAGIAAAVTAARPDVSAEVVMHISELSFGYPADVHIKNPDLRRLDVQLEQVRRILPRYTHLLNDAFRPVFGRLNGTHVSGDLPALEQAGIKVALLAHGSDVRDPDAHMARNPYSHFRDAPDDGTLDQLRSISRRNRAFAAEHGLPCYVTTPDLLDDLPQATWVPLVVDVDAWACNRTVFERDRPLVLHAPSKRWTKGTGHFVEQLEELDRRGVIEFRLAEKLPWQEMRDLIQSCDLVVDQFGVGAYGTVACEAMAAGKPVMAYLAEGVSKVIGEVPPIVNVAPGEVVAAIDRLLDDREEAARLGHASLEFARRFHDGRRAAQAVDSFLARG